MCSSKGWGSNPAPSGTRALRITEEHGCHHDVALIRNQRGKEHFGHAIRELTWSLQRAVTPHETGQPPGTVSCRKQNLKMLTSPLVPKGPNMVTEMILRADPNLEI